MTKGVAVMMSGSDLTALARESSPLASHILITPHHITDGIVRGLQLVSAGATGPLGRHHRRQMGGGEGQRRLGAGGRLQVSPVNPEEYK